VRTVTKAEKETLIDASNLILGRMASVIAKRLLKGETIIVINAEKTLVSGSRRSKVEEAKKYLRIASIGSPKYGPFHKRRPDLILRRAVRGMLPSNRPRGKEAYKRLKVYIGVPSEYANKPAETLIEASSTKLRAPFITLGELAREIGWKPTGER